MECRISDEKRQILNILRKNARQKKSEISRQAKIPASSVSAAMKSMENALGLRYKPIIDCRKIGHSTRAIFIIRLNDMGLVDFLSDHESINTMYRTSGDRILFVEAIFSGMKEMADFAEEISQAGAKIVKEFHVIEDLKREEFVI